ncbi:MAG: DUF1653 domain-containing protein [Candidatus Nomurabacteria bacterium]|jgi:hypothetical protein|nr:DUF1653 domain-containing protein [Candidatus Nomurabacteria bacterium]
MSYKEQTYFTKMLENARKKVVVGGRYIHSKSGGEYILTDLVIIEDVEAVGVVYQAVYGERLKWLRPIDNFTGMVEIDGVRRARFELVEKGAK